MERAANPEEEGTRSVSKDCTTYITAENTALLDVATKLLKAFRIVSIIIPSCATTIIPLQKPITIAANAISFTPHIIKCFLLKI